MEDAATQRWRTGCAPTELDVADSNATQAFACPGASPDRAGAFVGSVINDRYVVRAVLGHGATADVYLAVDQQLERDVAIKILSAELRGLPDATERFHDEGLVTARVHHPNVAAVFDTGTYRNRPFIVMEHLGGGTLAERISAGPLPPEQVHDIARQLLAALDAAHAAGVIHRDVKPSNILLSTDGVAKLADFGIAKDDARGDRTAIGLVVGTATYMAPERLAGAPATAGTDLYALGMVLRDALCGRRTEGSPENDAADPELARVVAKATYADPEVRFSCAADMLAALDQPQNQPQTRTGTPEPAASRPHRTTLVRRVAFAIVALVLTLGAVFAFVAASHDGKPPVSSPTTTADPLPSPLHSALDDLREAIGS